jgi:hypothetical protein
MGLNFFLYLTSQHITSFPTPTTFLEFSPSSTLCLYFNLPEHGILSQVGLGLNSSSTTFGCVIGVI